ncbi:hypothetical protein PanWU01x14_210990 [Parasponia andersonii]|uniref:Uncharacterized protein n=1 Tax=Parasponia andersonii TaxID=3476 RepID=A0A2P5BTY4_PARAD|nr:hypothetical protein PanWU01x14_210990 [Parasponia andersonii]
MRSCTLVVSELNFDIRVATPSNILPRQVLRLNNSDIEVLHLLDEVIGARKLVSGDLSPTKMWVCLLQGEVIRRRSMHLLGSEKKNTQMLQFEVEVERFANIKTGTKFE